MQELIKQLVESNGADIVCDSKVVKQINDAGGFTNADMKPYKGILKTIVEKGYTQQLLDIGSKTDKVDTLIDTCAQQNGLNRNEVSYAFACVMYGLGWDATIPTPPANMPLFIPIPTMEMASQQQQQEAMAQKRLVDVKIARKKAEESARKKAEKEAARLKKEKEEARKKAKAEADARRRAEIEAARKQKEKEAAENRRKAEELARIKAEEARRRAEEIAARKRKEEEEEAARKEAEAVAARERAETEKRVKIAAEKRKEQFKKNVEKSVKILGILSLTICIALIIANAVYTYLESDSWFWSLLAAVMTFLVEAGELFIVGKIIEDSDIETESPDRSTIAHLIWRSIWVTAMIVIGEIVSIWLINQYMV